MGYHGNLPRYCFITLAPGSTNTGGGGARENVSNINIMGEKVQKSNPKLKILKKFLVQIE
jgi:hypothetical protein